MSNKIVDREVLKVFRERFQKAIEDGDIVAAKALVAKQLKNVSDESGSYQDKPFLYQATGTDSNTTETPTAPVAKHLELRGNTVVWNQLVDTNTTEIVPTVGHKYLTMINGVKSIITPANDTPISVSGGTDNVFDLTKMFGAGKEPTSVVQFNRLFPLPYYAYNAGELKSCQSNKLIPIDYNQFENLNQFIRVVAGQTYRLMYWNGTALAALTSGSIEEYDGAKTLIQTTTYGNLSDLHTVDNSYPDNGDKGIKLTDETQWVKIVSSTDSNILFNLAWDGSRSDYESYVKHEYTLPNWQGKSAGNAYDSYYPDGKIIQRIGSVDLGSLSSLSWGKYSFVYDGQTHYYFSATNSPFVSVPSGRVNPVADGLCAKYQMTNYATVRWGTYPTYTNNRGELDCIAFYTTLISVYDKSLDNESSTVADFKETNIGTMVYGELAEPITTTGQQTFPENVEVDDFGTMEFTTTETESISNPIIPQGNRFFYPADYALLIDNLNQYTNGNVGALLKNTQIKAGGTALVPDAGGNVDIPVANGSKPGLLRIYNNSLGIEQSHEYTSLSRVTGNTIAERKGPWNIGKYGAILTDTYDLAVKLAMTDGIGAAWTDAEKAAGRARMGSAAALTQSTDLTPTTQTLTLTANTRYALGILTALDLTFPTTNVNDGDEIIIEFVSGSTATTLTLDNVNAIYNFSSINADKFVELNAQYKVSISKWVVYSAETDYTAM